MRIALLLLLAGNSCFAADLDQITIDLHRPRWSFTPYPAAQAKPANDCSMDLRGEFPKFICNDPGLRATYEYEFDLPIEMTQYPTFILKYRATNIDIANTLTCIWINEGERHATFPLIDFDKLVVDGKVHEIQVDLPTAPVNSKGTPFDSGPVNGVLVSVMNTQAGPGTIELIDLEFRSTTEPVKKPEKDQPFAAKVLDDQGQPIKNATVIVDGERKDCAMSATTDKEGIARLAPTKNELDKHVLHVEAQNMLTMDVIVSQGSPDPVEIQMFKSMQLGGFVQDEEGKPIANAVVQMYSNPRAPRDPNIRFKNYARVRTDVHGQWLSTPIQDSDQIWVNVTHPDINTTLNFRTDLADVDELRSGIATIVLKK